MLDIVTTRFAPSPTGLLHIGGARTALFNWLYAKHCRGKFFLRIDDTDKNRLIQDNIISIINDLKWLGINYDEEIIYQSKRIERHIEVANFLIKESKAYKCYCNENSVILERIKARKNKKIYKHKCSNLTQNNVNPVIRFKTPKSVDITVEDKVYGKIKINSNQLDDMIILRSNNTPTYIFATVVDDHDAKITHIIRGSDHITNTFKQLLIYKALNFDIPNFAHIPLIHGENNNKLSKRFGAISIYEYKKMGILPQAMCNYLLRLGWSYGNNEIISNEEAIKWFNLENIGRSPAQFNSKKLEYLNNYYICNMDNKDIISTLFKKNIATYKKKYLLDGLTELKKRANYLNEIVSLAHFYTEDIPIDLSKESRKIIKSNINVINLLIIFLSNIKYENWNKIFLYSKIKQFSKLNNLKIKDVYYSLRAPITGTVNSPGIINIMVILGKDECIKRLQTITTKNFLIN